MTVIKQSTPYLSLKFDQAVKGNIYIKKLSKYQYKITFNKISKFLRYQVWSDIYKPLNKVRSVHYENAKKWITNINNLNKSLKDSNKHPFTPTTVMEIGNKKYVFVITEAKLNDDGDHDDNNINFKVSIKYVKLSRTRSTSKKLLKLPCGHYDNVRFDIDAIVNINDNNSTSACLYSTNTASCGNLLPLCSTNSNWINLDGKWNIVTTYVENEYITYTVPSTCSFDYSNRIVNLYAMINCYSGKIIYFDENSLSNGELQGSDVDSYNALYNSNYNFFTYITNKW